MLQICNHSKLLKIDANVMKYREIKNDTIGQYIYIISFYFKFVMAK